MKTVVAWGIVTAICLSAGSVSGQLVNGLDGYWMFDEMSGGIAHDFSGHGYNGTLVNFPNGQGNWTSMGYVGGALQFGGPSTHEYVSVPNFQMPTTSMTLTAWVWANSTPPWATVAGNWCGSGAFLYSTFGAGGSQSLYVADGYVQGGINVDYGYTSVGLSLNRWHFLAFVANSQTASVTLMEDGLVTGSFAYKGQLLASSSQLYIGGDPCDTNPGQAYWDGEIEDLAIWTRALSSQELTSIFNAGLAGEPLLSLIPVQLAVKQLVSNVIVSWPTNFTGYTLQSTTNLGPSAIWSTNVPAPVVVNGQYTVTNSISGAQQFFRLSQ